MHISKRFRILPLGLQKKIQKKLQKKSIKKLQKKSTKKYIYEDRWKTLMYNNILYIKIIHII